MRTTTARSLAISLLALGLGACGTMELRQEAMAPIEVIESNYVESTNDAEIVFADTPAMPWQAPAAGQVIAA